MHRYWLAKIFKLYKLITIIPHLNIYILSWLFWSCKLWSLPNNISWVYLEVHNRLKVSIKCANKDLLAIIVSCWKPAKISLQLKALIVVFSDFKCEKIYPSLFACNSHFLQIAINISYKKRIKVAAEMRTMSAQTGKDIGYWIAYIELGIVFHLLELHCLKF